MRDLAFYMLEKRLSHRSVKKAAIRLGIIPHLHGRFSIYSESRNWNTFTPVKALSERHAYITAFLALNADSFSSPKS